MSDEQTRPEGVPEDFDRNASSIAAYAAISGFNRADGMGDLIRAVQAHTTPQTRVEPLTDPKTGITVLAVINTDGSVCDVDPAIFDSARDNPLYRRGTANMTSLGSFIAHVSRFGDQDSVVFANDDRAYPKLTAVLDYNRADIDTGPGTPSYDPDFSADVPGREHGKYRHGTHRTSFAFPLSDEWKAWTGAAGKKLSMIDFALFLEDRIIDVTGVEAAGALPKHLEDLVKLAGGKTAVASQASLIEVATGLRVNESSVVEEAQTLSSGEGAIRFEVNHDTKNATGKAIKVPSLFVIAIPVLRNGPPYSLFARFRYRKTPAGLVFWFDLVRPDLVFDHAFKEAVERVENETPATVLYGSPES